MEIHSDLKMLPQKALHTLQLYWRRIPTRIQSPFQWMQSRITFWTNSMVYKKQTSERE